MAAPIRPPSPTLQGIQELASTKEYSERLVAKLEATNIELALRTEELDKTHERFRELVAHSPAVIYKLKIEGQQATPVFVSDNVERLLGVTVAESATVEWWRKSLHPEDRDRMLATLAEGLREGGYTAEYRLRHRDGTFRWVLDNNRVLHDAAGQPQQLVGVWTDITERRRAEEALQVSEERYALALRGANDGLWDWNLETDEVFYSPRWKSMLGYADGEVENNLTAWKRLTHPADCEATLVRVADFLAGRIDKFEVEFRMLHKQGHYVYILSRAFRSDDRHGKARRLVGTHVDITERKRAEFELEQMHDQLLEVSRQAGMAEFATGVLHNVGNVLNSVNVATACLSDSLRKSKSASLSKVVALMRQHEADLGAFFTHDPKGKQLPGYLAQLADHLAGEQAAALKELGDLQKNVEHVKSIITVQQDSAKMSRSTEALQLTDLVEDALKLNASGLRNNGIQVIKEFEEIPPIMTEKHKVLQIVVNLVRNAIQACEGSSTPEKRLTIRVRQEADRVRLVVADNGSGILPENLPRVFAHGFTTKKDGHGFGLHSSAAAAKEMGGSLTVQSAGSGRGSTFALELPLTS